MKQYRKRKIPNPGLEESVFLTWGCWLVSMETNQIISWKTNARKTKTERTMYCKKQNCLFGGKITQDDFLT